MFTMFDVLQPWNLIMYTFIAAKYSNNLSNNHKKLNKESLALQ